MGAAHIAWRMISDSTNCAYCWRRRTDALRAADDCGVDAVTSAADDTSGRRNCGIERGIGLDHVLDGPAADRTDRAAQQPRPRRP